MSCQSCLSANDKDDNDVSGEPVHRSYTKCFVQLHVFCLCELIKTTKHKSQDKCKNEGEHSINVPEN